VYLRKRSHNQLLPRLSNKLRGEEPLQIFGPSWKNALDIVLKFGPFSENSSPRLVSKAGYGPECISPSYSYSRI